MTAFTSTFLFCLFPLCISWKLEFFKNSNALEAVVFTDKNSFDFHNRLYFENDTLKIFCQIRNPKNDTNYNRNTLVKYYATQGMAPTIVFSNSTWSTQIMAFPLLVEEEKVYWELNLSKTVLMQNSDSSLLYYEPWDFTVELGTGLDLFKTKGSLVVKEMEPLLSVQLGDEVKEVPTEFSPIKTALWQSHCSPNVAVLQPTFNATIQPYSG